MKKKLVSILFALSVFFVLGCTVASAAEYGGFTYEVLSDNTVLITDYKGGAENVTVPAKIGGKTVTKIGNYAFYECVGMKSVKLPDGLKEIGDYAFYFCTSLESIAVPDSVTTIGKGAFSSCTVLTSAKLPKNLGAISEELFSCSWILADVNIPSGVKSIGGGAFYGCEKLESITIPNSVVTIGDMAFYHCNRLSSVRFGNGLKTIEEYAFYDCLSLKTLKFPSSIRTIGDNAFSGCDELTSVTMSEGITSLGEYAFDCCRKLTSVNIPSTLKTLKRGTFNGNESLKKVTIADGVEVIDVRCFAFCETLETIELPGSVKSIGERAFSDCYELSEIRLSEGLKTIDACAFMNCETLEKIIVPSTVTSVGMYAFTGMDSLKGVTFLSPTTAIEYDLFETSYNLTIYCTKGSSAHQYAHDYFKEYSLIVNPETFKMEANSGSSIRLVWSKVADADGYILEQYKNGTWTRIKKFTSNATLKYSVPSLKAGTEYKFRIRSYATVDGKLYYSDFADTVTACTKPAKVTAKEDAVSGSSVRLTWNKVTGASGYIIQQYKNGQWVRVAKVTSPDTLKYSVTSLKSGTTYKFRVQAYKMLGGKAYYGAWSSTVTASTNPAKVTAKVDATSSSSVRLAWNKVTGASGYIVEQYKNGQWVRVAKVTSPDTLRYSVISLKSATTYKFRVRAYRTLGSKAYYGGYSATVTANTK